MNKVEIVCYLLSAYFFGISTGSFLAVAVHNAIYGSKKKKEAATDDKSTTAGV